MQSTEATQLTVYTGDSLKYGNKALYRAIVELLQREGIAGATVLHGIEGYGADRRRATTRSAGAGTSSSAPTPLCCSSALQTNPPRNRAFKLLANLSAERDDTHDQQSRP